MSPEERHGEGPDSHPSSPQPKEDNASAQGRRMGERILQDAPRLGPSDEFRFGCHPGVSCFGMCCGDVNIVLTPYDVLRLRKRLGLTSSEFLARHTVIPFSKEQRLPVPLLKMQDDEKKSCPFVAEGKCTVYEDRPWACRMYPVGFASPKAGSGETPFFFLLEEEGCRGFEEQSTQTIEQWIQDQGIAKYDEMGALFQPLAFDQRLADGRELDPKQMEMFWMATYDLDTFRRFVLESTFLDRFDVSDEEVEKVREDDEELMRFAFRWLAFALSGKATMKLKDDASPESKS